MKSFLQFIDEQEKRVKLFGTSSSIKSFKAVNPAKPTRQIYNGLTFNSIHPVPRNGKPVTGVMNSR